ncbi:hypothetical protein [Nannocystis sp.]|uniref:hypothetical protein n=1 Tax=Nannocystis sp. TaxID=1962667 RepID=UPI0024224552|nr:hypothetical protein [Nannocystis sp.]MBK7826040.1 hypothetical protein [Nannocystis sp.]MBK9755426.1 hypothetical protein [Nannocystis sp.]
MLRPGFVLALSLLVACGGGDTNSSSASTTDASTATTTASETGSAATGSGDSSGDTPTTDTPTTAAPTTGDESGTTGGAAFCNGWQGDDGEPDLVLHDKDGNKLMDGSTLPLECGAQGIFMFGLYPTFGGFTPASDLIDFAAVVDVDGFNTNPEGHFYSADPIAYYLGCEPLDGGVSGVVPIFPLDNLADLTALNGLYAALHVVLHTPDGDITRDLQVKLSVVKDASWDFCGG